MKRCASTTAKPIEFQRAVRAELAKFDQRTKVCTMNCGPHRDDPRDAKERKYLCGDCMAIEVPNGEVRGASRRSVQRRRRDLDRGVRVRQRRNEMNATEQHVAMAAKMYECRATARRLLGDKFHQRMDEYASVVRAVAKRDNCNDIVAGATVIKEAGLQGMDSLLLMAAVVEMTEPSNGEVSGCPPHERNKE